MPRLIDVLGNRKVGMQELTDDNYAPYMYRIGEGPGSLLDLVNGDTTFPKSESITDWRPPVEAEGPKRRRR